MSGAGRPCGPPGMQMPECGPPVNGSGGTWIRSPPSSAPSYVANSKIMVVAVAVLFAVVVFILCLHVYAKWYWHTQAAGAVAQQEQEGHDEQAGRMGSWRRRGRADARVRTRPSAAPLVVHVQSSVGLEKALIEALPTFEFDGKLQALLECAVCLEDFEAGEKGRSLPKCGHHFHLDCVDMWLYSHSTCPLCRASARPDDSKPGIVNPAPVAVVVPINDHQPVIGDVQAPFMAAMRASRRQRQQSRSSSSPISSQQLPPIPSSDLHHPDLASEEPHESSRADPKALLAREYEEAEIPSNVLFLGDQPSASSIRAPFQVTIDVPRGGGPLLHPASVMSPMARASASFRRLLSRGKSVVSPHDDDGLDQGSPSSPRTPPGAS